MDDGIPIPGFLGYFLLHPRDPGVNNTEKKIKNQDQDPEDRSRIPNPEHLTRGAPIFSLKEPERPSPEPRAPSPEPPSSLRYIDVL